MKKLVLDLIFPKFCFVCSRSGAYLCEECANDFLDLAFVQRCHVCNGEVRLGFVHEECREETYLDGYFYVSVYNRLVKDLIHKGKYSEQYEIFNDLGEIMAQFVNKFYSLKDSIVTYIPIHKSKILTRGFDQAEILASKFDEDYIKLFERIRKTKTQVGMTEAERMENLRDAFMIIDIELIQDKNRVLIVDDVFTTGSSLEECARLIKKKSPETEVFGLTFSKSRI